MGLRGFFILMSTISFWSLSASALMCSDDINAETSRFLKKGDRITLSSSHSRPITIRGTENGITNGTNLTPDEYSEGFTSITRPDLEYPQNVRITAAQTFIVDEIREDRIILKNQDSNNTYFLSCSEGNDHSSQPATSDGPYSWEEAPGGQNTHHCDLMVLLENHDEGINLTISRSGSEITNADLCKEENAIVPASHETNSLVQAGPVQRDI